MKWIDGSSSGAPVAASRLTWITVGWAVSVRASISCWRAAVSVWYDLTSVRSCG